MNQSKRPDFILPGARPASHDDYLTCRSRVPRLRPWLPLALMLVNIAVFAYAYSAL